MTNIYDGVFFQSIKGRKLFSQKNSVTDVSYGSKYFFECFMKA